MKWITIFTFGVLGWSLYRFFPLIPKMILPILCCIGAALALYTACVVIPMQNKIANLETRIENLEK